MSNLDINVSVEHNDEVNIEVFNYPPEVGVLIERINDIMNQGARVDFQASATHLQFRNLPDGEWQDLIALSEITGADGQPGEPGAPGTDGQEVSIQKTETHIQWRLGDGEWADLIALADLKGEPGANAPAPMYLSVPTISDRDAIPEADGTEGMVVFVVSEGVEYRLSGDLATWSINTLSYNHQSTREIGHYNFYVSHDGDDNNDGRSSGTAWKTLSYALRNMPSRIIGSATTLFLGQGEWLFTNIDKTILSQFIIDHRFNIRGAVSTVLTGISGTRDATNPWQKNLGSSIFTVNQYLGYYTQDDFPIGRHSVNNIVTSAASANTTAIKQLLTTIEFEGDRLIPSIQGNMNIRFENLIYTYSLNQFFNGHNNVQIYFTNVNFIPKANNIQIFTVGNVIFERCLMLGSFTTQSAINITRSYHTELNHCILVNTGSGTTNGGIHVRNAHLKGDDILLDGFAIGVCGAGDASISLQEARYFGLCIMNSTTAFELRSGFFRFITNNYLPTADSNKTQLYLFNVTNLLLSIGALRDIQLDLMNCLVGTFTNLYTPGSTEYSSLINIEERRNITYPGSASFYKEYISYRIAADLTERDAIPAVDRMVGLKTYVVSEDKAYRLVGGIDNSDWV